MSKRNRAVKIAGSFVLMLGSAVGWLSTAAGQTTGEATPSRPVQNSHRPHTLDEQVKRFAKALDLDEAQQAGLKMILERQQAQARQIQFDPSLAGAERIGRFRALQHETVEHIRALLTDEQKKKYDPLNHGSQTNSSQKYLDDWLKSPQH